MKTLIVIPARYASTRFPGKPLAMLKGASGAEKSLVRRTFEAALAVPGEARVVVATDNEPVAAHAGDFGAEVVMTPETCRNGTERCAAVLEATGFAPDVVVNLQGDAPLTPPHFVSAVIDALGDADCATPIVRCDAALVTLLREDRAHGRVGATTALTAADGSALYFSKEVLPFGGDGLKVPVFQHVGLYAYRPAALSAYAQREPSTYEVAEGLEQLRFLDAGLRVRCVEVDPGKAMPHELNNPVDVARIEAELLALGID